MKKNIFLIILCLFLTGCTANYNLEINDNTFKETIKGNVTKEEINKNDESDINIYNFLLNTDQTVFYNNDNIFYNKSITELKSSFDYEYTYTFNENNFQNSKLLTVCFEYFDFENTDNYYSINISGKFTCNYADKTNITLTTNNKVELNNADKVRGNSYKWTIDDSNKDNTDISILISKKDNNNSSFGTFKIIGLIIILLLGSICIFILKKKNNQA